MKSNRYTKRYVSIKEVSVYTSLPVKTLYEWAGTVSNTKDKKNEK